MIPLFKVRMSFDAAENVAEVLNSGYIGQGSKVEEFENELWKELSSETRPITVNSCTSAIDLALELCGVWGPDSEVISTPQTCWASNCGILNRRARIRWADIDPITGLIDPASVKKLITKNTKAIVAVDWAGKFCDYAELKKFGIPVIEDAAHVWDVFPYNKRLFERGDYICYSFQAIKFLTCGDGGILICPKEKEEEARLMRWYGLDRTKGESFRCTQNIKTPAGFKYQMNDISATIGLSNMSLARNSVETHFLNACLYRTRVDNPNYIFPELDYCHSYWLFSMHVLNGKKQKFIDYMTVNNITVSPVHYRNDLYDSTRKFREKELKGVTQFGETQICVPVGWWLSPEELDHIQNKLSEFD